MSRDTRLDEALERPFAVKQAVTRLRAEIDEARPDGEPDFWMTLVRSSDLGAVLAEIDRLLLVNGQIAKKWAEAEDRAASLSVSPVPSEPPDKHECEWCCSRNWTWHNVAAGRCSECTPAAVSPAPSEPQDNSSAIDELGHQEIG